MKINRKILGQDVVIELTSPELYDAYREYEEYSRRTEVLNYLEDIVTGGAEPDEMCPEEALMVMRAMIEDNTLLDRIADRYTHKRDRYPDGEQELNCVVDACMDAMKERSKK